MSKKKKKAPTKKAAVASAPTSSPPSEPPPSEPPPSEPRVSSSPAPAEAPPSGAAVVGAPWAAPLDRFEKAWTRFESRLLLVVLVTLLFSLLAWVTLKGLSSPLATDNASGTVFRAVVGITFLSMIARFATRRRGLSERLRNTITFGAALVGALLAPAWRSVGVDYFGQVLNWLQEGSSMTLFGGLRGIATRLTILLAFVGASLAAASGRHINIDVVLRFFPSRLRIPINVLGSVATAAVCFAASWGFFDYIAIEGFGVNREAPAAEKVDHVQTELSEDFFIWRKQLSMDMSSIPFVLGGDRWDAPERMNGRQWNEFIQDGGFYDYFAKEEVDTILAPDFALEEPRVPLVIMPGKTTRGLLVHAMNLMFSMGLIFIALRVMLRAVLVISGHASVDADPDEFEAPPSEGVIPLPMAVAGGGGVVAAVALGGKSAGDDEGKGEGRGDVEDDGDKDDDDDDDKDDDDDGDKDDDDVVDKDDADGDDDVKGDEDEGKSGK